jgi:NTE family protein
MPYLLWSEWRSGRLRFLECQLFPRHIVDHQLASGADANARSHWFEFSIFHVPTLGCARSRQFIGCIFTIFRKFGPVISKVKCINLALQGGSAHGAFTWGVLDRLIEEPRIEVEGVSATSAGAMNATVMAYGLTTGGRKGAREALEEFWLGVARVSAPLGALQLFETVSRFLSPYQVNPFNYNPLRQLIRGVVDFERLRQGSAIKLFISATNVRTGKIKIFTDKEITPDCVLASACLPFLYQAVEVDGEYYWDGGYIGNPALFPLIYLCASRDVLIVHVNPIERPDKPTSANEIMNRVNEISFNSSLMREMRAIAFVTKLIDDGKLSPRDTKRVLIHSVCADEVMRGLSVASKLNADGRFLKQLRALGRERAQEWIDRHFDDLGSRSTVDIGAAYL